MNEGGGREHGGKEERRGRKGERGGRREEGGGGRREEGERREEGGRMEGGLGLEEGGRKMVCGSCFFSVLLLIDHFVKFLLMTSLQLSLVRISTRSQFDNRRQ